MHSHFLAANDALLETNLLNFKEVFLCDSSSSEQTKQQQVWFQLVLGVATGHQHVARGPALFIYKRCAVSKKLNQLTEIFCLIHTTSLFFKSICRWRWGTLVANKPSIYYLKCTFWPQNLMFWTTGRPEKFKKLLRKHLDLCKTWLKGLGSFLKVEKGYFSSLAGNQSWPYLLVQTNNSTFLHRDLALRSHDLYKNFVCH